MSDAFALQAARRRPLAVLVVLAVLTVTLGALAFATAPVSAAPGDTTFTVTGLLDPVPVVVDLAYGGDEFLDSTVSALVGVIDGNEIVAYCLDVERLITDGDVVDESSWDAVGVPNLSIVAAILASYDARLPGADPSGFQLTGTQAVRSASIQTAIWHYTNGVSVTSGGPVAANIATIIAAVEADALEGVATSAPTVQIGASPSPASAGEIAGPFVLTSGSGSVSLSVTGGELVTWPNGDPLGPDVAPGTQFGLRRTDAGEVTVVASVASVLMPSRVYARGQFQPLMIVERVEASASASATATFTEQVTTTTVDSTTSTTVGGGVDSTSSTTVAGGVDSTSSTTVAGGVLSGGAQASGAAAQVVPAQAAPAQALPNTGSSTGVLLASGVLLLSLGGGLVLASTRRMVR